jgi:4-hydroxythreonine-4-phosphate dehydrogenase
VSRRLPLLLTAGEPAGIGPDCIVRAWHAEPELFADVVAVCPTAWLTDRAAHIGLPLPVQAIGSLAEAGADTATLRCWNPTHSPETAVICGQPAAATAAAVIGCIEQAARACLDGRARALVTGPIEKAVLRDAGFAFPGHTEFLADISATQRVVMMLASDVLRVALLTTHLALQDVPPALSVENTLASIRITAAELRNRFGISSPRLALCGLNPHAGERGHFGREEIDILAPAAETARADGIDIVGPLPADTLFSPAMRLNLDAIVCCYHDQGLIPIKALSFGEAVNVTLGLPFVRTSVDHGTALMHAGTDRVTYSSLMGAIRMADLMSREACDANQ